MTCYGNGVAINGGGGGTACDPINFWAYRSSNMTIPPAVETRVDWTAKLGTENPVGFMNLTTDIATIPQNGTYVISSSVEMVTAAAGSGYLRWYLNSVYRGAQSDYIATAGTMVLNFAATRYLYSGDTIEMRVYQNTGFNASLIGCCNQLFFSASAICLGDIPSS